MAPTIRTIIHPTDFSDASAEAFAHALRIAIVARANLYILHVTRPDEDRDWTTAPHVRHALVDWGLLNEHDKPAAACDRLGIRVAKVDLSPQSTVDAVLRFIDEHAADLIVLATEGREGIARWMRGSVAEKLARYARVPALFVPAGCRGFVDRTRGEIHLRRLLVPVDHAPRPGNGVDAIRDFAHLLAGIDVEERLLHVGRSAPGIAKRSSPERSTPVALRNGDIVTGILGEANDWGADLIGMPTAGHDGFLDAVRGSTTERVLRQAPCPVLAVPTVV